MKAVFKTSKDAGVIIDEYYGDAIKEILGWEIEVSIVIPWDGCFIEDTESKNKKSAFEMEADTEEKLLAGFQQAVSRMIKDLYLEIKGCKY